MASITNDLLKRFFTGNGYYAKGGKRPDPTGKEEVFYLPVMTPPDNKLLEQHLTGDVVVGAYTLRQDSTVMWMAFDVDSTDNLKAREIVQKLDNFLSDIPHCIEFSGRKGYHVLIFFKKPVPAENIRAIGEEIREAIGAKVSGDTHVEIFPKQGKLTTSNPLGNLLKVPLGIHPITGVRSKFVKVGTWEDGPEEDPHEVLDRVTTLEDLASCLEDYIDPIDLIVKTLTPHWAEGQRHDLSLYLSGWLATSGWDVEDAMTVIERLQEAAGGDLVNQLQCVTDTYQKYVAGNPVLGLQALSERLPGTTLTTLAQAISRQNLTPIMSLIDDIRLGKGVTYLKSRSAALAVISYLEEKGKILSDTNTGKLYWLDRTSAHLYSMEDSLWETLLYNTFGINTADSFGVATSRGIYHTAMEHAGTVKTHNRSWWDGHNLWLNLGGSYNHVISGDSVRIDSRRGTAEWGKTILNGEEGVIFRNRESGLKLDLDIAWERGITPLNPWDYLVNDLSFGVGSSGVSPSQQKELIKAWFLSTFFPNVMPTRPLLTIVADPGAGKTTAARRFLHVLEGPLADVNGVVTDKPDSLRASITAHKFIVLDNLEKNKSTWLVDLLNRVSTGTHIELRKLHTTNQMEKFTPDCFLILTATSLPFAEESLFTRLLPVELSTLKSPTPEYIMQRNILDNVDGIWMGIMGMLDKTVAELQRVQTAPAPTESRLADFSVFCARIRGLENGATGGILNGKELIKGLELMTNRQKTLLHEASPMVAILDIWLEEDREQAQRTGGKQGNEAGKWHTAAELNTIWQRIALKTHTQWIWETGQALSKHIQALEAHLTRNFGMQFIEAPNKHVPKKYRFLRQEINYESGTVTDNLREEDLKEMTIDLKRQQKED